MARRSGLGRGLDALIPSGAVQASPSSLRDVPLSSIRPNQYQPRKQFDEETLSSLVDSIRAIGVLQPVLLREISPGSYELIAGERRWRASRRAGLQTIPALVQVADDVSSLEQALVENLHREDLNALDEAAAYQQLIEEFHLTHEEVARRVGKSRAAISNSLRLFQLPPTVQRLLRDGKITLGHAKVLLGTPDRELQERLARDIVLTSLSVRALEDALRREVREDDDVRVDSDVRDGDGDRGAIGASGVQLPGEDSDPDVVLAALAAELEDQRHLESSSPVHDAGASSANPGTTSVTPGVHDMQVPRVRSERVNSAALRSASERPPGVLELEALLAAFLDTRVRVEMGSTRRQIIVDFATVEDLERIYRTMTAGPERG